jgi:hypothetical protein
MILEEVITSTIKRTNVPLIIVMSKTNISQSTDIETQLRIRSPMMITILLRRDKSEELLRVKMKEICNSKSFKMQRMRD